MSTLIYGKITNAYTSVPFRKNMCFEINNELVINAPAGSLLARSVKRNDFGYFVFDQKHNMTDFAKTGLNDEFMTGKISHHQKCLRKIYCPHDHCVQHSVCQ